MVPQPFPNHCVWPIFSPTVMFPTPHSLDDVHFLDHLVAFAYATWFDLRYAMDDKIILPFVRGDHLPEDTLLLAVDCGDFRWHMFAVDIESETPKFGQRLAREMFMHACGVH